MANAVLTVSSLIIEKMKHTYQQTLQAKVPQGGVFVAKPAGCTITAYHSGKVLFQGQHAEIEAAKWGETTIKQAKSPTAQLKINKLPPHISQMSLIGSDEVGTGDYFGPMVVCAAFVKKEDIPILKEMGVRDSKNLKDPQIAAIARQLIKIIPYSQLVLANEKYNDLQASGMSQGKMKGLLHNRALINIQEKIDMTTCEGILIDQFAEPGVYFNYLKEQKTVVKEGVFFSTKAEEIHLAVAAASIIARYSFLREWEKLNEIAGFTVPKGAGALVDQAAARIIREKGLEALKKITKFHFANTVKAQKLSLT